MRNVIGFLLLLSGIFAVSPAAAKVVIDIDLSSQTMHVVSSSGAYDWPISSARDGYVTPDGTFAPESLQTMHYSKKYYHSPMPHSIFFAGGYAIHGTYETGWLGHPASHGCVRISPDHAALLFDMVREEGAVIHISGRPPASHYGVRHYRRASSYAAARRGWGYSPWGYAPQGPAWGASSPYGGY
ncbi:MAG: L,D-transpeptidase [Methylovirgula sp.]|nr:L,D-transpeptidase [Methylovirgula sp.]